MPIHNSDYPVGFNLKPGPVTLPTGGQVYSTGKVLIGIAHKPRPDYERPMSQSALWVQTLMLAGRAK